MENQANIGIQPQFYEPFEAVDSNAENSNANASLADDSAGAHAGGNATIISPHVDGENVNPAPPVATATNSMLNRYGIGDTVILGRPEYAVTDDKPSGNSDAGLSAQQTERPTALHGTTSWMKEASISGSNDSGGSMDGGDYDNDNGYGDGGDYGGGGDVGGGGDGGSGPTGGGEDSGGSANAPAATNGSDSNSNCLPITGHDANGNPTSDEARINVADSYISSSHGGSPNDYISVDSYGAIDTEAGDMGAGHNAATSSDPGDSASHGRSSNDYSSVDNYGVGSQTNENTNVDSTQSSGTSGYQGAVDAASRLLGKPQGTVSYDDVLGTLTQIRGASQNPELTMREQQALNSVFMAVYTRGNSEHVIGPTVTNEFLNAAITSMMFGGSVGRIPRPGSPTGPMLPGTTGNRTAVPIGGTSQLALRNSAEYVSNRIGELAATIPANSRGRITMSVAIVEDRSGNRSVLIGTSEPNGYIRTGVGIKPGETVVSGPGHAEANIVDYANANNLRIVEIGATRPICEGCQVLLEPLAPIITTPLKPSKQP